MDHFLLDKPFAGSYNTLNKPVKESKYLLHGHFRELSVGARQYGLYQRMGSRGREELTVFEPE